MSKYEYEKEEKSMRRKVKRALKKCYRREEERCTEAKSGKRQEAHEETKIYVQRWLI